MFASDAVKGSIWQFSLAKQLSRIAIYPSTPFKARSHLDPTNFGLCHLPLKLWKSRKGPSTSDTFGEQTQRKLLLIKIRFRLHGIAVSDSHVHALNSNLFGRRSESGNSY